MKVTVFKRKGSMDAGVRPQSKVASDCTLAPDPRPAGSTLGAEQGPAGSASGGVGRRLTQKRRPQILSAVFVLSVCSTDY